MFANHQIFLENHQKIHFAYSCIIRISFQVLLMFLTLTLKHQYNARADMQKGHYVKTGNKDTRIQERVCQSASKAQSVGGCSELAVIVQLNTSPDCCANLCTASQYPAVPWANEFHLGFVSKFLFERILHVAPQSFANKWPSVLLLYRR